MAIIIQTAENRLTRVPVASAAPRLHPEAVVQSLQYATLTARAPAILIIIERPSDWRHWRDLLGTLWVQGVQIKTQTITVAGLQ